MGMISGQNTSGSPSLLYEQVAREISGLIEQGTFRAGDRIPSIRQLSRRFDVSINTVMQAYTLLEDRRLIEARPSPVITSAAVSRKSASLNFNPAPVVHRPRSRSAISASRSCAT